MTNHERFVAVSNIVNNEARESQRFAGKPRTQAQADAESLIAPVSDMDTLRRLACVSWFLIYPQIGTADEYLLESIYTGSLNRIADVLGKSNPHGGIAALKMIIEQIQPQSGDLYYLEILIKNIRDAQKRKR